MGLMAESRERFWPQSFFHGLVTKTKWHFRQHPSAPHKKFGITSIRWKVARPNIRFLCILFSSIYRNCHVCTSASGRRPSEYRQKRRFNGAGRLIHLPGFVARRQPPKRATHLCARCTL